MSDKCLARVQKLLDDSSITSIQRDEIINQIKIAQAEQGIARISEIDVDRVAQDVSEQLKLQKAINKRNALEDEIKVRNYIDNIINNFDADPDEGLISILVGSNQRVTGARSSAAAHQQAAQNQLIIGFNQKVEEAGLTKLLRNADEMTQLRITRVMEQTSKGLEVTEHNADIIKLGQIMEEYSELVRNKLNARGTNISKLWGYVVRQSHDPFLVRDAVKSLGKSYDEITVSDTIKFTDDINYAKNYTAWRDFVMDKLDYDRTFADVKNIEEFMRYVYNSLVRNQTVKADGAANTYGYKGANLSKDSKMKRVLHFKDGDAWFDYNSKFGVGSLTESFFSGLTNAGRNIGLIDSLGTRPVENFKKIQKGVQDHLIKQGRSIEKIKSESKYEKWLRVLDGSIYTFENFAGARYSASLRSIASMAKLGGAAVSAISDIGLYASEMKHQGRSFLSSMFEAFGALAKIKEKGRAKEIAELNGIIFDNMIYDVSARYQVGDPLSKGFTKAQRVFFKLNLLSWWTNTLKESAMLGTSRHIANQRNLPFDQLSDQMKSLFDVYNINASKWDVIRKNAIEITDDGKEFLNLGLLDNLSDADVVKALGLKKVSQREIDLARDTFKVSLSGMLLDRTTYAVIEPDAKVRGDLTQGLLSGTVLGEAIRFVGQFKAFPLSIIRKTLGRDFAKVSGPNKDVAAGILGLTSTFLVSGMLGYAAMTAKDFLKGKSPRDPARLRTILDSFLQGGGLGIYGDILFQETRSGGDILGNIAGPIPLTGLDLIQAMNYAIQGKPDTAGRTAYNAIRHSIPFANLFYTKAAIDYLIGYQMLESISPGTMNRMQNRMKKQYDQEFIFGNPL
jgi:hypothetical protein